MSLKRCSREFFNTNHKGRMPHAVAIILSILYWTILIVLQISDMVRSKFFFVSLPLLKKLSQSANAN